MFKILAAIEAQEKKNLDTINELFSKGYPQASVAAFLQNGALPPLKCPVLSEEQLPQTLSDILVYFSITDGKISGLMEMVIFVKLNRFKALENLKIKTWWEILIKENENFFLVGESILRSLVFDLKKIYFPALSEKEFKAKILTCTDPYFHDKINKILDVELFAVDGMCVGDK